MAVTLSEYFVESVERMAEIASNRPKSVLWLFGPGEQARLRPARDMLDLAYQMSRGAQTLDPDITPEKTLLIILDENRPDFALPKTPAVYFRCGEVDRLADAMGLSQLKKSNDAIHLHL